MADAKKDEAKAEPVIIDLPIACLGRSKVITPKGTDTVDGKIHGVTAVYPQLVFTADMTLKQYQTEFNLWFDRCTKIGDGALIRLLDSENKPFQMEIDGKMVDQLITPSDDIPTERVIAEEEDEDDDGNKFVVVKHGQVFRKTLPVNMVATVSAVNGGLRNAVNGSTRKDLVEEFKKGGTGRKGRKVEAVDVNQLFGK